MQLSDFLQLLKPLNPDWTLAFKTSKNKIFSLSKVTLTQKDCLFTTGSHEMTKRKALSLLQQIHDKNLVILVQLPQKQEPLPIYGLQIGIGQIFLR